jgi:general secretion pathway protein M
MISIHSIDRYVTRYPSLSALIYLALIVGLCLTTLFVVTNIVELYRARNVSLGVLSQFSGRSHALSVKDGTSIASLPAGSPVLEGKTATVASAALLQRIIDTITRAGGTVISSEIERQGAQSKDGYVTASATCELEQAALQKVLYEIEAGMPFLFVDRLVAQAPTPPAENKRLHVVLAVSGLWGGAK